MKILLLAAVSFAALGVASPALASNDVNINLQGTNVQQKIGPVTQRAASVAAAVGSTGTNDNITSQAVNGANMADVEQTIDQLDSSLANGNLLGSNVQQNALAGVNQAALSVAGSGNLGAVSNIESTAANLGNNAAVTVKVTQH